MFKPTHFRLQNAIHWPGSGPTTELSADNIRQVDTKSDHFTFVHASGHAVEVPKAEVTAYGVYDADDVPNLPNKKDYKDDASQLGESDEPGTSQPDAQAETAPGSGETFSKDSSAQEDDKLSDESHMGSFRDTDASQGSKRSADVDGTDTESPIDALSLDTESPESLSQEVDTGSKKKKSKKGK